MRRGYINEGGAWEGGSSSTHLEDYTLSRPIGEVSYGVPSSKLNQMLFKAGVNIIDLQGLNEPNIESAMRVIPSDDPLVIICCVDLSTGFFKTIEYENFKYEIIKKYKLEKIIFLITNIENTLKKLVNSELDQSSESENAISNKYRLKNFLNYDNYIPKVKHLVNEVILKDFKQDELEIFLFDPYSDSDTLVSGVEYLRNKLVVLRQEMEVDKRFLRKSVKLLGSIVNQLQNQMLIIATQKIMIHYEEQYMIFQAEIKNQFLKLKNELHRELLDTLDHLEDKLFSIAKNREQAFMEDNPNESQLTKKIIDWVANCGFQDAMSSLIYERCEMFFQKSYHTIEDILKQSQQILMKNVEIDSKDNDLLKKLFSTLNSRIACRSL